MATHRLEECAFLPTVDVGPALKTATRAVSKSKSKRGGHSKRDHSSSHLTKRHSSVRHLYACERTHCWQWVPDKKLSKLWNELDLEQRAIVLQTHEKDRLAKAFCEDIDTQMWSVQCGASDGAKKNLNSMIWLDRSSLMLYKEIFSLAVEENVPMVIDMEVVAAVDGVVQDFCAAREERRQAKKGGHKLLPRALFLLAVVLWFWDSSWTLWVLGAAAVARIRTAWGNLLPLDPRTFPEGSNLWVEYREREHVRLMLMSAMVRVFEVRLLRIWEARRKLCAQQGSPKHSKTADAEESEPPRVNDQSGDALKQTHSCDESLQDSVPSIRQRRKRAKTKKREENLWKASAQNMAEEEPSTKDASQTSLKEDHQDAQPPSETQHVADDQPEQLPEQPCAVSEPPPMPDDEFGAKENFQGAKVVEDSLYDVMDDETAQDDFDGIEGEGDEIDAEFARLAREHQMRREKAACKGSQTDRGNQILKSLCEKLKVQLEQAVPP